MSIYGGRTRSFVFAARQQPRSPPGAGLFRVSEVARPMQSEADLNAKLTARQLAAALGVTPQLVNRWRTYGWLDRNGDRQRLPAQRDADGNWTYRYIDGVRAEAATRRSPKSFRKPAQRELATAA